MVNFYQLSAEIVSLVWGTPANFIGFRILAALLHGTVAVGVSQTLQGWTEGATYIRQAVITLGIGPHLVTVKNYTVSKKHARFNQLELGQNVTYLQNSVTARKLTEFATKPI